MTPAEYRTRDLFRSSSEGENTATSAGGGHPEEVFRLPREPDASSLQQTRRQEFTGRRVGRVLRVIGRLRASWCLVHEILRSEGILLDTAEQRGPRGTARRATIVERPGLVDELEEKGDRREEIRLLQLRY